MSILGKRSTAKEMRAVTSRQPIDPLASEVYSHLKEEAARYAMRGMTTFAHVMSITDANPVGIVGVVSERLRHEGFRVEAECTEHLIRPDQGLELSAAWRISW